MGRLLTRGTGQRDNERVADAPLITTELLFSRQLPAADEQDVLSFFRQFGIITRHRRVLAHRSGALEWLVLAALPMQAFLQNLGTLTSGDAYLALKGLIDRLAVRARADHSEVQKLPRMILQDSNSGLQVVIESDLPEIAYRQLHQLNLAQFASGPIHFDRSLGCWRADGEEAGT